MAIPAQVTYFDFTAGSIGRWKPPGDGIWSLAAAEFCPIGTTRKVRVIVSSIPNRWGGYGNDEQQKLAKITELIQRAKRRLNDLIPQAEEEADEEKDDDTVAFDLDGDLVDSPAGDWGRDKARCCVGPFPRT